jgi:oligopeptide transport system substrate-binding protein
MIAYPKRFVRSLSWQFAIIGTLFLALLFLVSSCTNRRNTEHPNTFYTTLSDDLRSIDPALAYDSVSWEVLPSLYDTLYQYSYLKSPYEVEPLLAADFPKFSADRLTLTIPIRQGIRFQDDSAFPNSKGRELQAQDFIFAFKRHAIPSIGSSGWWIFDGRIKGMRELREQLSQVSSAEEKKEILAQPIEGLKAIDAHTLQITLTRPYPQLLYVMTMPFMAPMAKEVIDTHADEKGILQDKAVGTGPFLLKEWQRGERIVLERNPNYYADFYPTQASKELQSPHFLADAGKPLPFLQRIHFEIVEDSQRAWIDFLRGRLDLNEIPKDQFQQALKGGNELSDELSLRGIELHTDPGATFFYLAFNIQDPLLGNNKHLRQALSSAINREEWIAIFTQNRAEKMTTALPPGISGRPENTSLKYDFHLERAKDLLKKAGYPKGEGLPVINLDLRRSDAIDRQLGQFFSQQFAAIGVRLNVIFNTFPGFLQKIQEGNIQIAYGGWSLDYPDPENVYQLLYGPHAPPGPNESAFNHPEMNQLFEKMSLMAPSSERSALIKKMDDILQEEVPWALGLNRASFRLVHPWVKNYREADMIKNHYKYLRIDPEIKNRYQQ